MLFLFVFLFFLQEQECFLSLNELLCETANKGINSIRLKNASNF